MGIRGVPSVAIIERGRHYLMLIPEDSPLRQPPRAFSRRQMLILDGIRYAAEMAHLAYDRLYRNLQGTAASLNEPRAQDTASAMLDAWSIVDSAHRFRDLVENMPGLGNSTWKRLLRDRTEDVAELRDCVQHQLGEIDDLISHGGQFWGYLSWAEVRDGRHTGKWLMMTAGSDYVGDQWLFIGPAVLPFPVPPGRVRLNAFGRGVYLGRTVHALILAISEIGNEISNGTLRAIGEPALERRGADVVYEGWMEVVVSTSPATESPQ
jgi:hypothetical protein